MSKRQHPLWMPLYVTKFLADTAHLTAHECGVYINMLCAMWKSDDGTLPNDGDMLAKIGECIPRTGVERGRQSSHCSISTATA